MLSLISFLFLISRWKSLRMPDSSCRCFVIFEECGSNKNLLWLLSLPRSDSSRLQEMSIRPKEREASVGLYWILSIINHPTKSNTNIRFRSYSTSYFAVNWRVDSTYNCWAHDTRLDKAVCNTVSSRNWWYFMQLWFGSFLISSWAMVCHLKIN